MVAVLSVVGALISVIGIGIEWYYSDVLLDKGSQLESLLNSIEVGMTFDEFLEECWMFPVLGFFVLWAGLSIAFPKRRRGSRA